MSHLDSSSVHQDEAVASWALTCFRTASFAQCSGAVPVIRLDAPIPPFTVRLATQQIQYACTVNAGRTSGKNLVINQLPPACREEGQRWRMLRYIELLHERITGLMYPWDSWLAPQVMQAFLAWHTAMHRHDWARAGGLSMPLASGRAVAATRLHLWRRGNRGMRS